MTPAEEAHLCACEALALFEAGRCSGSDLITALRCIRNNLEQELKPARIKENERKASNLLNI